MTEVFNGGVVIETILPVSVPSGGTTGQSLVKKSSTSYDLEWKTITGGGGGSGDGDMLKSVYDPDNDGKIDYLNQVSNKPSLGTSAALDVPTVGNANSSQLVKGSDTRLTDSRSPLSHAHSIADVSGLQAALDAAGTVLNGTGFVKVTGTTVSYDNSSYLTGINSSQVTTALGFTPYNATNPSGYTTNVGTVTTASVSSANGFTGSVANASTTPSITIATSVTGILKGNGTAISAAVSGTDFKTIGGVSIIGAGDISVGGTGTVTTASVVTANGLTGSVANATTTPAITLSTNVTGMVKANGTAFSAAVAGTDYLLPSGSGAALSGLTVGQVSGAAPLASPTFTGTPLSTTAAVDTNTTQIATTAYVVAQGYLKSATASSTYATIASQGTAAAGVLTTSTTDTNSGRVVKVGDYGLGLAPISNDNWNTITASGRYRNTITSATGVPEAVVGLLMTHVNIDANTANQVAWNTSSGSIFTRNKASGTWGAWSSATSGGVTTVSVASANGFTGSVANATTTPAITVATSITGLLKGNGTAISAVVSGTDLKTINGNSIIGSGDITIAGGGGGGTVTTASVVSANGFAGSVATATTTPAITVTTTVTGIVKGNGTALSAATAGTDYLAPSNVTSSSTDITAGKLLKVGDYGLGTAPVSNDNWNTLTTSGKYINTSSGATGIPVAATGLIVSHTNIDSNTATQVAWDVSSNLMYSRRKTSGTFTSWSAGVQAGGITRSVVVTSGNFTAGNAVSVDYIYLIAGAHAPTMPTAVGNSNRYTFKNNHSVAVTISTTSSQTIDGTTTISIAPQDSVDLISTGSNWSVI